MIRNSMQVLLDTLGDLPDPIPPAVRLRKGLMDLRTALDQIHRPADQAAMHKARRRLIWEEAFVLQAVMACAGPPSWRRTPRRTPRSKGD